MEAHVPQRPEMVPCSFKHIPLYLCVLPGAKWYRIRTVLRTRLFATKSRARTGSYSNWSTEAGHDIKN